MAPKYYAHGENIYARQEKGESLLIARGIPTIDGYVDNAEEFDELLASANTAGELREALEGMMHVDNSDGRISMADAKRIKFAQDVLDKANHSIISKSLSATPIPERA